MLPNLELGTYQGVEIVHFHERDSSRVVYTPHDRRVVTRRQICDDRRFQSVARSVPAVHDVTDLALGIIPPMIVLTQLSLEAINAPVPLCNSKVGLCNASETPC